MPKLDELVKITLDKERHLRLALKGMLAFEKLTGRNLLKGFNLKDLTMEDFAALAFACLIHEDKDLTYDDVLILIDASNLPVIIEAVDKCIEQSFPEVVKSGHPLARKSQRG